MPQSPGPLLTPDVHAERSPDRPAVVMGSGAVVSYREFVDASRRVAQLLRSSGLRPGDHVAILMENNPEYLESVMGALRAGLYVTPVNWHLTPEEAIHVVADCGARCLITSRRLLDLALRVRTTCTDVDLALMVGGPAPGFHDFATAVGSHPAVTLDDETEGALMCYSSGTTGRPKGIVRPLPGGPFGRGSVTDHRMPEYGVDENTVYLSPAPMYHSAPVHYCMAMLRHGATVVAMERFDAAEALRLIERHQVTHAQFVPTMFVRMLKLPEQERRRHDLSSLSVAIHAAAPCPVDVKKAMIDWWGPIIEEYYSASEGIGSTRIGSEEWLSHPGSVGRPEPGTVHILDDEGVEVPAGTTGTIWFSGGPRFEYHGDLEKTRSTFNDRGWGTLGDLGHVDEDGYLYLSDRRADLILSGGVNIYPAEIEAQLVLHPAVADVAVLAVPNEEFGEEVKAVVELVDGRVPGLRLERELIEYSRARLARFKCPRSVDFVDRLPRTPAGKLLKRSLMTTYWGDAGRPVRPTKPAPADRMAGAATPSTDTDR
jgi:acyl-CoA synthetase (AMP-forming)/AMP-acid ligase II